MKSRFHLGGAQIKTVLGLVSILGSPWDKRPSSACLQPRLSSDRGLDGSRLNPSSPWAHPAPPGLNPCSTTSNHAFPLEPGRTSANVSGKVATHDSLWPVFIVRCGMGRADPGPFGSR